MKKYIPYIASLFCGAWLYAVLWASGLSFERGKDLSLVVLTFPLAFFIGWLLGDLLRRGVEK